MPIEIAGGVDAEVLEELRLRASATSVDDAGLLDFVPSEVDDIRAAVLDDRVIIATDDHGVVGFAYVSPKDDESVVEFQGLFVERAKRGQGYGRRLCRAVLALAASRDATAVAVIADARPDSIYGQVGFEVESTVETQLRPAVRMIKTITDDDQAEGFGR